MDWNDGLKGDLEQLRREVQDLRDERAIAHVMYRYLKACDTLKDPDVIASHFTEDAVWEGQGNLEEFGVTRGRAAIRAMFVENPKILPFTAHFVTNPTIVLALDRESAWGEWHCLEAATLRDGRAQVWIAARYDNDFAKVGGDWKISHIRYKDTFVCTYEAGWLKERYVSPLSLQRRIEL
jgi:ketosteroid isomerase-like protein